MLKWWLHSYHRGEALGPRWDHSDATLEELIINSMFRMAEETQGRKSRHDGLNGTARWRRIEKALEAMHPALIAINPEWAGDECGHYAPSGCRSGDDSVFEAEDDGDEK